MRDMHIYSNEEYLEKQIRLANENAFNASYMTGRYLRPSVIKNYIYYDVPVKIS